jgi:protein TonB
MLNSLQTNSRRGKISRILTAAAVGISVTLGLLYLMQLLIEMSEEGQVDTPVIDLQIGIPRPTPVPDAAEEPPPERPPDAESIPSFTFSVEIPDESLPPTLNVPASEPASNYADLAIDAFSDGPLVTILKVKPPYPVPALIQGIEGYVIVQYDVRLSGVVDNIMVVESSNDIFDAAAVDAVSRFLYKPRVVDGVNKETKGLKRRFQFEIRKTKSPAPE